MAWPRGSIRVGRGPGGQPLGPRGAPASRRDVEERPRAHPAGSTVDPILGPIIAMAGAQRAECSVPFILHCQPRPTPSARRVAPTRPLARPVWAGPAADRAWQVCTGMLRCCAAAPKQPGPGGGAVRGEAGCRIGQDGPPVPSRTVGSCLPCSSTAGRPGRARASKARHRPARRGPPRQRLGWHLSSPHGGLGQRGRAPADPAKPARRARGIRYAVAHRPPKDSDRKPCSF